MLIFALRAIGMYFLALIMIRLLGKRALGELGPFDFVIMTGVGHTVVSIALDKSIPFYEGIVILATLAMLEYIMGYLALKNQTLSHLITGKPVILIDKGQIVKENMAREKFNADDLLQELRKQGIREIEDVDKGILESCGGFSVILKEEDEPITRRDLGLSSRTTANAATAGTVTRDEFFAQQQEPCWAKEGISLPALLQNIDQRLDSVCRYLNLLEARLQESNNNDN